MEIEKYFKIKFKQSWIDDLAVFWRLLKAYRLRLLFALLCSLAISGINGAIAWSVKPAMDQIFVKKSAEFLYLIPILVVVLFTLRGIFTFLNNYLMNSIGAKIVKFVREAIYEKLLKLFNYGKSNDLLERDCNVIEDFWELLSSLKNLCISLKISFQDFKRIMGYLFSLKRYYGEERMYKGVNLMGIIEAGGIRKDITFLAGLIDGDEPKIKEWILFPDSIMKLINLPSIEDQIREQKYYFDVIINSNSKVIYLTFPQIEEDRKILCSFFLSDYIMKNKINYVSIDNDYVYSLEEHLVNKGEYNNIKLMDYITRIKLSEE